jgi:hypothetical protein
MSSTATPYGASLDVSGTTRPSLERLVLVELRKMVDTRAGFWLLVTMGGISAIAVVIFGFAAPERDHTFANFSAFTGIPQGFLLPVLGILLITQEWGQRTAMVTFTLEPHRGRVLAAKAIAAVVLGLAVMVVAQAAAAIAALVFGGSDAFEGTVAMDFVNFGYLQVSGVLQGLAFGLLFLNSPAAIVTYLVLPTVFSVVANVWGALAKAAPWIDLGTAQGPMIDDRPGPITGEEWAHVAVATLIWVALPFVVGLWRVLRAEVK